MEQSPAFHDLSARSLALIIKHGSICNELNQVIQVLLEFELFNINERSHLIKFFKQDISIKFDKVHTGGFASVRSKTYDMDGSITQYKGGGMFEVGRFGQDHSAGLIFTASAIHTAKVLPNAPLSYKEKGRIGELTGVAYSRLDGRLVAYFVLDECFEHLKFDRDEFAIPRITVESLGCFTCGRTLRSGGVLCDCVHTSPRLVISKMCIRGATIQHKTHDEYLMEIKSELIADVGCAALSNLIF